MDESNEKLRELREHARTDLFWLAKNVLGYKDLVERVHQPVCDCFVKKDRRKPLDEQDTVKQRLILDPRGHFKTTLDLADAIQWILNFPDIRILLMTGTRELASRMIGELKFHFQHNDKLRALFPEYAAPDRDWGTTEEFTVPARQRSWLREPTVSISTVESVKAGSHYDVIKCDDLVHENNVSTRELIDKTITAFNHTTFLLEPYGYRDVVGTRYDHSDLYGWIIDNNQGEWRVHARKAWSIREDNTKVLLFPERFPLAQLEKVKRDDPYLFNCQYLNDPTPTEDRQFTRDLLLRHSLPAQQIKLTDRIFITWDLGFSREQYANWSVGAVGMYDQHGRLYVLDIARGRFDPQELVLQIVFLALKWRPVRVGIEKAAGSELLEPGIKAYCYQHGIYLPLEWIPVNNQKNAKNNRIASLLPMLKQGQMFFAAHVASNELLLEFERFPKYRINDIPDAISLLLHYKPMVDVMLLSDETEELASGVPTYSEGIGAGLIG